MSMRINNSKMGCGLGILGGVICMVGLVLFLEVAQSAIVTMSLYMLAAVLFFALAGAFSRTGQWSWKVLMFMAFVTAGIVLGGTIVGYYDFWFGFIETVIGILIIAVGALGDTKKYLTRPRDA